VTDPPATPAAGRPVPVEGALRQTPCPAALGGPHHPNSSRRTAGRRSPDPMRPD
jgi:hypothetical protein